MEYWIFCVTIGPLGTLNMTMMAADLDEAKRRLSEELQRYAALGYHISVHSCLRTMSEPFRVSL